MAFGRKRLGALVTVAALLGAREARATDRCAACHLRLPVERLRAPALALRDSPHREPLIGCAGCHGGDRADPTVRTHTASGFTARPARADIPKLCGGCHGDARFVRRFNASLPVGQLVVFETSVHGERFKQGDGRAPVCTSCHGVHEIMSAADPRSRVHASRVASTCASCHEDSARMQRYGIPTNQFRLWSASVHGQGVARGNLAAPTCISCHTAHGATPPAVSSVARVCGHCHRDQLERFRDSPHGRAFAQLGLPECERCHGNHGVEATSETLVGLGPESMCGKCHAKGQKAGDTVLVLAAMIRQAHEQADAARTKVDEAARAGLGVSQARIALDEMRTAERRLGNALHDFDPAKLRETTDQVASAAERATAIAKGETRTQRRSRFAFVPVVLLLAAHLALLLAKIRRTPAEPRQEGT